MEQTSINSQVRAKIETGVLTKMDLANRLGIARGTLDTRLKRGNWKKSEVALLKVILSR